MTIGVCVRAGVVAAALGFSLAASPACASGADATAFHDFHVLQIAFKSVWQHAYDKNVQALVEQVYLEHMKL